MGLPVRFLTLLHQAKVLGEEAKSIGDTRLPWEARILMADALVKNVGIFERSVEAASREE